MRGAKTSSVICYVLLDCRGQQVRALQPGLTQDSSSIKGAQSQDTQACMTQVASLQARLENGDIYTADLRRSLAESGKRFHSILVCSGAATHLHQAAHAMLVTHASLCITPVAVVAKMACANQICKLSGTGSSTGSRASQLR